MVPRLDDRMYDSYTFQFFFLQGYSRREKNAILKFFKIYFKQKSISDGEISVLCLITKNRIKNESSYTEKLSFFAEYFK